MSVPSILEEDFCVKLPFMDIMQLLFYFLIIIPSAILHEYAHGAVADWLGDPTARYAGRLSLNPKVHIDLWGTILLPLLLFVLSGGRFLFAYAKPVPYNPYNLRNQRFGPVAVAFAGPAANFALAAAFGFLVQSLPPSTFALLLSVIVYANVLLGVFNLVPLPPLDGSKLLSAVLPPATWLRVEQAFARYGIFLVLLFVFFFAPLLTPIIEGMYGILTDGAGVLP